MFRFFEKKSRSLPVQKTLREAEKLALEAALARNEQVAWAADELAPLLRAWGRREAADELEQVFVGVARKPVTGDPLARRLLTVAEALQAAQAEIRTAFDRGAADEEHFPSTIDPRIQHVQLLLDFFGGLDRKRVLDAGCGKGRFARILKERFPGAEVWGIDISAEMLRHVPPEILTSQGTLTNLPFEDDWFDAVYAIESLEHAVEIESAVSELCRVTRPGGRIVIIDKNIEKAGQLAIPEWEKWFGRPEIERLLARSCQKVESDFISYWADVPPDGLFLAWKAVR